MMDAKKFDEYTERVKKFIDAANRHCECAEKWRMCAEFWVERGEFDHAQKCLDRAKGEQVQAGMRLRMTHALLDRME